MKNKQEILESANRIKTLIEELNMEINSAYDLGIGVKLSVWTNPNGEVYRNGISAKIMLSEVLQIVQGKTSNS